MRTDPAFDMAREFHRVVEDNRDNTGINEYKEDEPKQLPSPPAVFPGEWQLWEESWVLFVVVLQCTCSSLELAFCGGSTVVVCVGLRPVSWSLRVSPFEFLIALYALPAIPTATVNEIEGLLVALAQGRTLRTEVYTSSGDLILVARMAPSHVHTGTTSADHLRHGEGGAKVTM